MSRRLPSFPALAAVAVASLGSLLIGIGARSPHTHANLEPGFHVAYVRTAPAFVGPPERIMSMTNAPVPSGRTEAARGRALFFGMMCASCHGLGAEGGRVGPELAGLGIEEVLDATEEGPGGMPRFHLTRDEIRAIVAFLKSAED